MRPHGLRWQTAGLCRAATGALIFPMSLPSSLADLWAGRLPLPTAFWHWMIFWGFLLNLGATIGSLAVLVAAAGAPHGLAAGLSVALHVAPIPYNIACLVGVWRSAGHKEVAPLQRLITRTAAAVWTGAMLVI